MIKSKKIDSFFQVEGLW